jgi:two-component system nitrogen regulation response regulator NtrX
MTTDSAAVLIVDDEEAIRYSLRGILEDEGFSVLEAKDGESALAVLDERPPELVFLDIWMPGLDGMALLDVLRERNAELPVVMISGHGNIETAVQAIKKGAFDFIEKPLSLEKVVITAQKALEFGELRRENKALRARVDTHAVQSITGSSPSIRQLREQIARVAPTDAWVLILGENGAGKEIVARSIHAQSRRSSRHMIAVNCAAIPEELIESELFGHEKGAFTGADAAQAGKFELADKGTIFLDEIGDMSLKTQAKILRVLEQQAFERVGGRKTIRVDVRVIAATNKDLESEIGAGAFREDLYYRLKVFPLLVPPLRERTGDLPRLIEEFVARFGREHGFKPVHFTEAALGVLAAYAWPGNVRELKNFVERMHIVTGGGVVDAPDLPPEFSRGGALCPEPSPELAVPAGTMDMKTFKALCEARFLEAKLAEYGNNISRVAEAVSMDRSSLYRKLKAYDIQIPE